MRSTVSQYAEALEELTEHATPEKVQMIIENFRGLLRRRREGKKMGAVVKRLEKMEAEKKGQVTVTVTTAHEADKETKQRLLSQAERLFPHKKAELQYVINKNVIGGAVFSTDEVLYDATLATELKELKKILKK
ncbi:MAG: F0F1 ATP synthase subunit delta [bacterium]|nr:F0F1 ATP synthase subunit delta [bacterium]